MDEIKTYYIAFDIGCIECGEVSALLGVFSSGAEAKRVCDEARDRQEVNWHGQHNFEIFRWNGQVDVADIPNYGR